MNDSNRILTTHVGSLERPKGLGQRMVEHKDDPSAVAAELRAAVADVVRRQADVGIDIVDDGEYGKSIWMWYVAERLNGLERQPYDTPYLTGRDRAQFAEFYAHADSTGSLFYVDDAAFLDSIAEQLVCTGPITYRAESVQRDIANLKAALGDVDVRDSFMPVVAPASIEVGLRNEHYASQGDLAAALADAMREEYLAIVEAGITLQVDDAWIPAMWDREAGLDKATYRRHCESRVELLNHALRGIPEDRIRYHLCWGSWHGPHAHDIPFAEILDLMLAVNAGTYVFEAANVRHEHEYHLWESVDLPEGKILAPGVVTHSTNVLEHPELVAERIVRFADRVGRENVIAGTDCGFGSRIHPQLGWAKLESLVEGARLATGRLWG